MIIPVIIENSEEEIKKRSNISKNFADLIQVDIAEDKYVNSSTINDLSTVIKLTRPHKIDLDLMVENPMRYLKKKYSAIQKCSHYVKQGSFTREFLTKVKELGYLAGVGVGPETNMANVYANIDLIDYVQFYAIIPGKKGQPFVRNVIHKIRDFKQKYPQVKIQVDGAVGEDTILDLKNAGADDFIVGTAIFNSSNPKQMYIKLSDMVDSSDSTKINSILDFPEKEIIKQVAILGGAAWSENDEPYQQAFETARLLALNGYEVVNGGGPGVMEASTKGAHAGGGDVLAITYYPNKPKRHYEGRALENNFDTEVKTLDYFDRTKVMLQTTQAHIVFKGSIGTLSEFGMTWISSWIHEPHNKPIILFGDFWKEFITLIEKHMFIVKGEEKMMKVCTTPQEVIDYLKSLD